MGTLNIELLGTKFKIQANEDSEYLEKLLSYYKAITEDAKKIEAVKSPLQVSILAGIMLCDELYQEKSRKIAGENGQQGSVSSFDEKEIEERTKAMIEKISRVL